MSSATSGRSALGRLLWGEAVGYRYYPQRLTHVWPMGAPTAGGTRVSLSCTLALGLALIVSLSLTVSVSLIPNPNPNPIPNPTPTPNPTQVTLMGEGFETFDNSAT